MFASCFPIMIAPVLEDEVISIFNAAVAAICVAHIITCLWFWIGSTVQVGPKLLYQDLRNTLKMSPLVDQVWHRK